MPLWLMALIVAQCATAAPAVKCVPDPVPAITLFRNSHATAGAWLAKHYGLARKNERDRTLVATAWVHMRRCGDCTDPNAVTWDVATGLANLMKGRGAKVTTAEKCAKPTDAKGAARFPDYKSEIDAGRPALVTLCYDSRSAKSRSIAKGRREKCLTVAGIGYVVAGGTSYIIARDGLKQPDTLTKGDVVTAASVGLGKKGVWSQNGTSIYKWDGSYANLVLVLASKPKRGGKQR